ncbi:hypothetical protein LOD99_6222 [Oopsacas minuta]|uniref:Uncharacterized protein n=1 Tax=Oopsacas minuta TaxID=111878 RepID=A0AAV7JMG6_9METZ|nr:hypothetical protein LOD99_6222 [Oopsacas minuta]
MQTMQKTLRCEGRSMKWLHMHIRSIHQIEVLKRKITNETNMKLSKQPNISAVRTLDYYINDTSLPAILARMTACDGPSFNVFTTSLDIRRSISALGHSIPKSVSGVRDQIVKYGQQLREEVKRSIHIPKSKGYRGHHKRRMFDDEKLGRSIASLHQLCYAHGLQLVIQNTFYQKHNEDIEIFSDDSGTDDEDNTTT